MTKNIYQKPTTNIIFNVPLRLGTRPRYLLSPLVFYIVLGILASAMRHEKEIKCIYTYIQKERKKERKLSFFADGITVYIKPQFMKKN